MPGSRRVIESFPLYDTVLISPWIKEENRVGWFRSYNQIGSENKISFFDQRKQTDVDLAYCNLDAKERFPYGFMAYTFGVLFQGPSIGSHQTILGGGNGAPQPTSFTNRWDIGHLFTFELPKHCGVRVKLEQSDVLESNIFFSPSGTAANGGSTVSQFQSAGGLSIESASQTGAFGEPNLLNRFRFPKPLVIPRNAVFSIELEFSKYAKELLNALPGPEQYVWREATVGGPDNRTFAASAMIQVSLIGARAVQQRGEESYAVAGGA